jgi:sugar/nucleoside kinase (ribokinase family)
LGILVVGSIGLDNVATPFGKRTDVLGGSCTYFGTAASLYDKVAVVGVVGTDFPHEHTAFLQTRRIDLRGLQTIDGKTFRWSGCYGEDLDVAKTLETQLNVFAGFRPDIPKDLRETPYVFLANIDPDLQLAVLDQVSSPRFVALDSMNYWITSKRERLAEAVERVDLVLVNEDEARMFTGESQLISAAEAILALGPHAVVVKKGQHGAMLLTRDGSLARRAFFVPAYPLVSVVDPTGAGDTFAGGLVGHLARTGDLTLGGLRRAVVHGAVIASFTVQGFSVNALRDLTMEDVEQRYTEMLCLTHFDILPPDLCRRYEQSIS